MRGLAFTLGFSSANGQRVGGLVYVTDREGDIAALMTRANELGQPADWLIRSQHNRNVVKAGKLWDMVDASQVLGEISFILPGRAGKKARQVKQELRAQRVKLPGEAGPAVTCVVAQEIGAPAGVTLVVWRLLTNREAQDADAVIELIDWYRARWEIEMFFHVLKTGCKVQACSYRTWIVWSGPWCYTWWWRGALLG